MIRMICNTRILDFQMSLAHLKVESTSLLIFGNIDRCRSLIYLLDMKFDVANFLGHFKVNLDQPP